MATVTPGGDVEDSDTQQSTIHAGRPRESGLPSGSVATGNEHGRPRPLVAALSAVAVGALVLLVVTATSVSNGGPASSVVSETRNSGRAAGDADASDADAARTAANVGSPAAAADRSATPLVVGQRVTVSTDCDQVAVESPRADAGVTVTVDCPTCECPAQAVSSASVAATPAVDYQRLLQIEFPDVGNGLNNMKTVLVNALCLGRLLGRTVVFPGWTEHRSGKPSQLPFDILFNRAHLEAAGFAIVDQYQVDIVLRSVLQSGHRVDAADGTAMEPHHRDYDWPSRSDAQHVADVRAQVVPKWFGDANPSASGAQVLITSSLYHWTDVCEYDELAAGMAALVPTALVRRAVDRWIEQALPRPYAAVHIREFEDGRCPVDPVHVAGYMATQYPSLQPVSAGNGGHAGNTELRSDSPMPLFVATDGRAPEKLARLRAIFPQLRTYDGPFVAGGPGGAASSVFLAGMVDLYILSRSDAMFGNEMSSFARSAALAFEHNTGRPAQFYTTVDRNGDCHHKL